MAANKQQYKCRLLLLGDSACGKSSLLYRFCQGDFSTDHVPTIGIDFRLKNVDFKGRQVKAQIWDTAGMFYLSRLFLILIILVIKFLGQERFKSITHNYFKGAHGIVLVYDVSNATSFENIRRWVSDVNQFAENSVNMILIGNKCDLSERAVSMDDGKKLAAEFGIPFFETSAKADIGVNDAFSTLITTVCERLFSAPDIDKNSNDALSLSGSSQSNKGCCS